jgi:endonuclease/exonuclease/phosphatase family metal-dependent hydrolase
MRKITVLLLILISTGAVVLSYVAFTFQEPVEKPTETIKIAAFNIQVFGRAKRQKENVMDVLTSIVREFDLILIQEIRDSSEETIPIFLQEINDVDGPKYSYIRSERLGRSTSKEAYAYLYNTETVKFVDESDYVYDDVYDVFEREPYIASFVSGNFDFTIIGIHIKPDDTYSEMGNLTNVINFVMSENPKELDTIMIGDFNADGTYFDETDLTNPLRSSDFYWVITNDMDTMTKTDYSYDRIVLINATYNHEYITDSASVFKFDIEYDIMNQTFVWEVSDHYPIYAEFKTDVVDDD